MHFMLSLRNRSIVALLVLLSVDSARAAESEKHCFWEATTEQGTLYLLGSIHFLKAEFYPLDPVIENAFERSSVVVFETDLQAMKDPATQLKMAAEGMCPPGKTLKDFVSEETYALLQARLKEQFGGAAVIFDRFKPWMAAMTLLVMELQKLGFNPEHGVDQYFHDKARKAEKRIEPLETLEFQMSLFTGLTEENEDSLIRQTLEEVGSFKDLFGKITEAWQHGDSDALLELIVASMRDHPEVMKLFLVDRNERWVPQLTELMQPEKPVFAVVGAGHLVGTNSVVELLKRKGIKVRQH